MYFATANAAAHLGELEPLKKEGRIYVAPFAKGPLIIQSPPVPIVGTGEHVVWILPTGPFRAFLETTEAALQATARAHAGQWNISPDQVTTSFKTFFRAEDGAFKVRYDAEFAAYDAEGNALDTEYQPLEAGQTVRILIQLDKVCMGKTEMGGVWRIKQARLLPPPTPCLIDPELELPDDDAEVPLPPTQEQQQETTGGEEEFV